MIRPRTLTQFIKALLRNWGIKVERYDLSSSHDLRLVKMLAANSIDLVIDVGASRGEYARALQSHGYSGRILSFEPLRSAHAALVEYSRGNRSWQAADRMALGDTNGTVVMNIAANSTSSSVLSGRVHAHGAAGHFHEQTDRMTEMAAAVRDAGTATIVPENAALASAGMSVRVMQR